MTCAQCNQPFIPKKHNQKFCAKECRNLNLFATARALNKKLARMALQVAKGASYYQISKALSPMERREIKKKITYLLYSKQFKSKL